MDHRTSRFVCIAALLAGAGLSLGCARGPDVASGLGLRRVVIYRNGVGYFEREGRVDEEDVTFKVRTERVGDFLATLAVIEQGDSSVKSASFPVDVKHDKDEDDAPPRGRGSVFPLVIVASLSDGRTDPGGRPDVPASDAIENALRTLLTMMALDEKRGRGLASLSTYRAASVTVTTLNIPIPFVYAIDRAGDPAPIPMTKFQDIMKIVQAASDAQVMGDIGATLKFLKAEPYVEPGKIAITGFCWSIGTQSSRFIVFVLLS